MFNLSNSGERYFGSWKYQGPKRSMVTVAPAYNVVTVNEVKTHLRLPITLTGTDESEDLDGIVTADTLEDDYIESLIPAAIDLIERYTGRKLETQQLSMYLDNTGMDDLWWNGLIEASITALSPARVIELDWRPIQSVDRIVYYDDNGTETAYDAASNVWVDTVDSDLEARVVLKRTGIWPSDLRNVNCIRIDYTAGYDSSSTGDTFPPALKHAIKMVCAFFYQFRGDCDIKSDKDILMAAGAYPILSRYKVVYV